MSYKYIYKTRENLSDIILNSVEKYLTGLWFENSKYVLKHKSDCEEKDLPIFIDIKIMNTIPFGEIINDIAKCT